MNKEQGAGEGKSRAKGAVIVLICICLGSGVVMSGLYWWRKGRAEAKARNVFHRTLASVLGEAKEYSVVGEYPADTKDEVKVYMNKTASGVLYATTGAAQGYQSQIKVLVSVEVPAADVPVTEGAVIRAVSVVESQETLGLVEDMEAVGKDGSVWDAFAGKRPTQSRSWFEEQFTGKRLGHLVMQGHSRDGSIAAITGATITSEAFTEAVRRAVKKIIAKTAEVHGK